MPRLGKRQTVVVEKRPGRGAEQFPLRLPDGMRDRLKVAAAENGRFMNAEIVARLETSLATPSVADQLAAVEATVRALAAKIDVSGTRSALTSPASEGVECDLCRGYGLTNQGHNCARCGGSGVRGALTSPASQIAARANSGEPA